MVYHERNRRPSGSSYRPDHEDVNIDANNKKYEPAYDGAKFDQSGYCLKHPMIRLCRPATVSVDAAAAVASCPDAAMHRGSESSSSSQEDVAAYSSRPEDHKNCKLNSNSSTSPPVKYLIIRKTCPMCGEHALRNERKINKPGWAHGYQPPKLMERRSQQMMVASPGWQHEVHHQLLSSPVKASSASSSRSSTGERSRSKSSSARKEEVRHDRRGSSRSSSRSHRNRRSSKSGKSETSRHGHERRGSSISTAASNKERKHSNSTSISSSSGSIRSRRSNSSSSRASTTDVFQSHRHQRDHRVGMTNEGDPLRRLHTTEALMNHNPRIHQRSLQKGKESSFHSTSSTIPIKNTSNFKSEKKDFNHSSSNSCFLDYHRHQDDDKDHHGNADGYVSPLVNSNRRIAMTKAQGQDQQGESSQRHGPRASSISRRNSTCTYGLNSTNANDGDIHESVGDINTTKSKRSSSITRSIQSKLESRIQSRRSFISSLRSNGNGNDASFHHDCSDSTIDTRSTMRTWRTLSSANTGKSFLSCSSSSLQKYRELQQQQPNRSSLSLSPRSRSSSLSISAEDQERLTRSPHQEEKGRGRSLTCRRGSHASASGGSSRLGRNECVDGKKHGDKDKECNDLNTSSRSSSKMSFSRKSSMDSAHTLSTRSLATFDSGSGIESGNESNDGGGSYRRSGRSRSRSNNTTADNVVNTQSATLSYKPRKNTNRRSLSRNAERVLSTTSTMDGSNDREPSTSLRFEVPFHPVTGMCHYHPGVCLAVKNIGKGAGGWKVVREVCPRCKNGW